eukprot:g30419.t2
MMIASILGTMGLGMYRYFQQKYQKQPKTKTFIDCDDLNDLTRLFSYVGQDTETFLVLCSPAILTRKWCVGEMALPPPHRYGISMEDVAETFRWLNERDCQTMPENITPTTSHAMVSDLVAASRTSGGRKSRPLRGPSHFTELTTNFPVLVDPQDTEAMATALPRLLGTSLPLPSVLPAGKEVSEKALLSMVICSNQCFKSEHIQKWLLQACRRPECCMKLGGRGGFGRSRS